MNSKLEELARLMGWSASDVSKFVREISERMNLRQDSKDDQMSLDKCITDILKKLGVQLNMSGFKYVREAINQAIQNPRLLNCVTYELYPIVAEKFQTTSKSVERCIRHAILTSWGKGELETIERIFGTAIKNRPTNSEFIAAIADYLRLEKNL